MRRAVIQERPGVLAPNIGSSAVKTAVFSLRNNFSCPDPVIVVLRGLGTFFLFSEPIFHQKGQLQTELIPNLGTFLLFFSYRPRSLLSKIFLQRKTEMPSTG